MYLWRYWKMQGPWYCLCKDGTGNIKKHKENIEYNVQDPRVCYTFPTTTVMHECYQ